jgi:hypothetical protein
VVREDAAEGARGRHQDRDRLPHLSSDWHHGLSQERRKLEVAQQMDAHESARTTGLYDRRSDEVSLDEIERIGI